MIIINPHMRRFVSHIVLFLCMFLGMQGVFAQTSSGGTSANNEQTCPISASTIQEDVEREILRLLQTYDFATLRFPTGDNVKTITLIDAFGVTKNNLQIHYTRGTLTTTEEVFDCILVHPDAWYQPVGAGWSPTGLLPHILQRYNGMTLAGIRDLIATKRTSKTEFFDYSIGNANFTILIDSPFPTIQINTVYNHFNQKQDLAPMEILNYYAFNASPQVKKMRFKVGEVPAFTRSKDVALASCGTAGVSCAPDFFYTLRQADVEKLYQAFAARRTVIKNDQPLTIGSTFGFMLQYYGERRVANVTIKAMNDARAVTELEVQFLEDTDTIGDPVALKELLSVLGPTCKNWAELWNGTCGTEIVYCNTGECGFTTGLEEVRKGLQESNVSTTNSLKELVRGWLNFALGFLFLLTVVVIITAGIMMVGNFGNEDLISKAKSMIIYGIVGLLLIILAYPIVNTLINVVQ